MGDLPYPRGLPFLHRTSSGSLELLCILVDDFNSICVLHYGIPLMPSLRVRRHATFLYAKTFLYWAVFNNADVAQSCLGCTMAERAESRTFSLSANTAKRRPGIVGDDLDHHQ